MSPVFKPLLRLALLCSAVAVIAGAPAPALAATTTAQASATRSDTASISDTVPCWKRLLNDWYDGTINNVYPIPCYASAIKHLPSDLRIYSSAKDDIQAAEQAAINHRPIPKESSKPGTTTTTGGGTKHAGGFQGFLNRITPGNPDSFPLPLLILGALAILLIIAGAIGMLWQRSHPRDEPPAPS